MVLVKIEGELLAELIAQRRQHGDATGNEGSGEHTKPGLFHQFSVLLSFYF